MGARCYARSSWLKQVFTILCGVPVAFSETWTQITVKNMTQLGPQLTPRVTYVSRDGGFSVLVNGAIVWLYDDTECMSFEGAQLSFVSNTAAFADQSSTNISLVQDFGVEMVGEDQYGRKEYAILANTTVGTGGWIPFQQDELEFNKEMQGRERVAICELHFSSICHATYILRYRVEATDTQQGLVHLQLLLARQKLLFLPH